MKRTSIIFALLATSILSVLWYGYSIPVKHQASLSSHYYKSPNELWEVITDYEKYHQWRENVYAIKNLSSDEQPAAWQEIDAQGKKIPYEVVSNEFNKQLVVVMVDKSLPFASKWTFDLIPDKDAKGTTLKITENGEIDSLLFRVITHFLTGHTSEIETYLRSLENKFILDSSRPQISATKTESTLPKDAQHYTAKSPVNSSP